MRLRARVDQVVLDVRQRRRGGSARQIPGVDVVGTERGDVGEGSVQCRCVGKGGGEGGALEEEDGGMGGDGAEEDEAAAALV